jgi:outer membrane protein OmpA-like peptidoglycan-associated protein
LDARKAAVIRSLRTAWLVALVTSGCLALGCWSAYQKTYDKTYTDLNAQADAQQKAEEAAHAEAQKYASVVYFATGSAQIDEEGQRDIAWFVEQMKPFPQAMLDVQGFTDSTGDDAKNVSLSAQRAQAVVDALVARGIDPSHIRQAHYAANYQAATNNTPKGRRNNRRVEITVQ